MADLRAYCDRRRRDDVGWTRSKTFQLMKGLTSSLAPLPPLEAEDAGDKMSLPSKIPGTVLRKKSVSQSSFQKLWEAWTWALADLLLTWQVATRSGPKIGFLGKKVAQEPTNRNHTTRSRRQKRKKL